MSHTQVTKDKIGLANKVAIKKLWENPSYREKMSVAHLGQKAWNAGKKGEQVAWNKGKKWKTETKAKMSKARIGKEPANKGKKSNISKDKHWNWKGGINDVNDTIRKSLEYRLWRTAVFERDNYTCVWCGIKSISGIAIILHADHIKPFAYYPELRFAIDNGRTLCINCHKTTETYGYKARKK
jgi:hypothetical protein